MTLSAEAAKMPPNEYAATLRFLHDDDVLNVWNTMPTGTEWLGGHLLPMSGHSA
jgi:hypothetical protein